MQAIWCKVNYVTSVAAYKTCNEFEACLANH
jgi:hypothetical protein